MLGCGRIGRWHAELIAKRVPGLALSRVFDVRRESADEVGDALGAVVAATPEELIEADDVDAIAICSSTDTHVDLLVAGSAAGKPIFCEKPCRWTWPRWTRDWRPWARPACCCRSASTADRPQPPRGPRVADGDIGQLHLVRITSRDPAPPPIAYIEVSGGIFCDMTIHDFDMARFVTGSEIEVVYATGAVRVDPAIGEAGDLDTAVVVLRHDGVLTTIDNSRQAVYGYDQRVEAFGRAAWSARRTRRPRPSCAMPAGASSPPCRTSSRERYEMSYLAEWEDFAAVVRDGGPSPVDGRDGREAHRRPRRLAVGRGGPPHRDVRDHRS